MKSLSYFIVLILVVAGSVYVLKPHPAALESEYLEFRLGAKPSPEMKATEETLLFKTNGEIYYSIFSKKPFAIDGSIEVFVKSTADLSKVLFTEELGTVDKKIMRPVNPVKSETAGSYLIEVVKDGMPIARKMFTISGDVQAAPAPVAAPVVPAAPVTAEVKVEAPSTGEVKMEAPAAPATVEVKTGL